MTGCELLFATINMLISFSCLYYFILLYFVNLVFYKIFDSCLSTPLNRENHCLRGLWLFQLREFLFFCYNVIRKSYKWKHVENILIRKMWHMSFFWFLKHDESHTSFSLTWIQFRQYWVSLTLLTNRTGLKTDLRIITIC